MIRNRKNNNFDPTVSVVMTVYNAEKFLKEAVDSILNQSYSNFEFIIINDGSTDNCSQILNAYKDKRIRLIERENIGLAESLNEAIEISRGKYVARMDHDDISLKNRLELQLDFMENNPDVGILGAQAYLINEEGDVIGQTNNPVANKAILKCLEFVCPLTHPTYFIRKDVYHKLNGYRNINIEDYDFLLRASENGIKILNMTTKVLMYRTVSSGMSLINLQRTITLWALVRKAHRLRVKGIKDDGILEKMYSLNDKSSVWFGFVFNLQSKLYAKKAGSNPRDSYVICLIIGVISILHYQLFSFKFNHLRSKIITRYYR